MDLTFVHLRERKFFGPGFAGAWHLADENGNPACGVRATGKNDGPLYRKEDHLPQKFCKGCEWIHRGFYVQVLAAGQPKPYADSYYSYAIRAPQKTEDEVRTFCQELRSSTWPEQEQKWMAPFCVRFDKTGDDSWAYDVQVPFTD